MQQSRIDDIGLFVIPLWRINLQSAHGVDEIRLWKIKFFALKAAWGVTKLVLTLVLLPVTLVLMVAAGLIHLALPILIIVGIISLFSRTPAKA